MRIAIYRSLARSFSLFKHLALDFTTHYNWFLWSFYLFAFASALLSKFIQPKWHVLRLGAFLRSSESYCFFLPRFGFGFDDFGSALLLTMFIVQSLFFLALDHSLHFISNPNSSEAVKMLCTLLKMFPLKSLWSDYCRLCSGSSFP